MVRLLLVLAAAMIVYFWWRPPTRAGLRRGGALPLVGAVLLATAYLLSPLDALPDVTPLGLIDDLVILATTGWWVYEQWRRRPRPAAPEREPAGGATPWDPYRVLEVRPGASRDEITRAYREQMKRYHPDRVSGLGEELQEVAHRKTLEIQRAYTELSEG